MYVVVTLANEDQLDCHMRDRVYHLFYRDSDSGQFFSATIPYTYLWGYLARGQCDYCAF